MAILIGHSLRPAKKERIIPTTPYAGSRESHTSPPVMDIPDDEDEDLLPVPLDSDSRRWLAELAAATGRAPGDLVATMIREIRVDDEAAHNLH